MPVPIELPRVPATNPFAVPLTVQPVALETPLADRLDVAVTAEAAAYVDAYGTCRRVVFTRLPLPGLAPDLQESLAETAFTRRPPSRRDGSHLGSPSPWTSADASTAARSCVSHCCRQTSWRRQRQSAQPAPAPEPRDLQIPTTRVEQLDQLPTVKRFRVTVGGHDVRQGVRLMLEIGSDGRCLGRCSVSCPDGLRQWLLRSLAEWRFRPQSADGPTVVGLSTPDRGRDRHAAQ